VLIEKAAEKRINIWGKQDWASERKLRIKKQTAHHTPTYMSEDVSIRKKRGGRNSWRRGAKTWVRE